MTEISTIFTKYPLYPFFSGFDYWASWNSTFPELAMQGVGPLEIPLEEGYRAKDWTIQLRWPHEMINIDCFSDKVTTMDCGGAGEFYSSFHPDFTPFPPFNIFSKDVSSLNHIIILPHISGMQMLEHLEFS